MEMAAAWIRLTQEDKNQCFVLTSLSFVVMDMTEGLSHTAPPNSPELTEDSTASAGGKEQREEETSKAGINKKQACKDKANEVTTAATTGKEKEARVTATHESAPPEAYNNWTEEEKEAEEYT
eukprot:14080089-Ditylum_brightwellii.AAC.2